MVCLIHGEDCFHSSGGASFFVGRVKLLLLWGGAGGCVAFKPGDVPVSVVSLLVVPSLGVWCFLAIDGVGVAAMELASSMASRGTFGLRCSLSVGACFLAGGGAVGAAAATSVSSAGGSYNVSFCFLRAKAGDGDATTNGGFVRKGLASSLRRGGCYKSSPFCGIHFPAAGRCASSGGSLPAIVFLDGGGGQRMPVFTRCGDGRCAWEAIYSASSPSNKSSAASTWWTSSLVQTTAIALTQRTIASGIEEGDVKTLEAGVAVVIFSF